ncbi:hypothetical protein [Ancylobacter mangrovi]|uniref:hypothetical protein n=1 Tax=Ancylobacter mangrovi TaxID=2972472 RepID=UPI0021636405|nr:hypothetical protein [Ancylobacter mangrovi]MCS0502198.1 hypothetical protein [Ancylobacter mangrovi]
MTGGEEIWPVPSPVAGEPPIRWVFGDGLPKGFHWREAFFDQGDERLDLANLPTSAAGLAYPAPFRFDPQTGRPLSRPRAGGIVSGFPALGADGFASLPSALDLAASRWRAAALPKGAVALFRSGSPSRAFCLTAQGELFFRAEAAQAGAGSGWVWLDKMAPNSWPKASFAVASSPLGFATVLAESAVIGRFLDGIPGPVKRIEQFAGARFCGPPSRIERDRIAFPLRRAGALAIAVYDMAADAWEDEIAVEMQGIPWDGLFTLPVQNTAQPPDVYWCAPDAFLHLTSEHGTRLARLQGFEKGTTPVAGAPMLRDVEETIHALCRVGGDYAFTSLTPRPRSVRLNGPHLAAGRARYNGRDFYPSIAGDDMLTFRVEAGAGRLILPVAFRTDERGATDAALVALVDEVLDVDAFLSGRGEAYRRGTLYWHSGGQLYPLRITLELRSPFDLLVLCSASGLVVGSAGRAYEVSAQ